MQNDLKQRTKHFALRIIKMFAALPKTDECRVLGKQVLRSGTSVGANYREAAASRSTAEFISKLGDCHKELEETQYWLELLMESGCVSPPRLEPLRQEASELTAIIVTSIRSAKRNAKVRTQNAK
jgi:four helix bundle protein